MTIDPHFLILFRSAEVGAGESDLGAKLTELLLKNLAASEVLPAQMIFLNSAIFLTTEGSGVIGQLKVLEDRGTRIVSCITCLEYHARMEKIQVGEAGNMKDTVAALTAHSKVVTL